MSAPVGHAATHAPHFPPCVAGQRATSSGAGNESSADVKTVLCLTADPFGPIKSLLSPNVPSPATAAPLRCDHAFLGGRAHDARSSSPSDWYASCGTGHAAHPRERSNRHTASSMTGK